LGSRQIAADEGALRTTVIAVKCTEILAALISFEEDDVVDMFTYLVENLLPFFFVWLTCQTYMS